VSIPAAAPSGASDSQAKPSSSAAGVKEPVNGKVNEGEIDDEHEHSLHHKIASVLEEGYIMDGKLLRSAKVYIYI